MRKIRDVLRLSAAGMSKRQIATSLGVSATAAGECLRRARRTGLTWPLPEGLTDEALEARLYPPSTVAARDRRPQPDWASVHRELRRPGVTLQLLWEEHRAVHPDGYGYSRFCERYRAWEARLTPTMRQSHVAGERMFVDYAGTTLAVIDASTGEVRTAQLFVAALGASSYVYAEATWTQGLSDWIGSHTRALAFMGGVPAMVVSDNLRSGITKACFYEPAVNRTYAEMAAHYGTAIVPARPYRARDKAKVEVAVQVATRFVIAKLRNRQFFSLSALNGAIAELVAQINNRVSRHLGASRRALFEDLERPALKPLPADPYIFAAWKECRVGLDYHVEIEKHYYSVPHQLLRREGLGAHHGAHDRGLPPRQARRRACALVLQSQAHDGARAYAVEPPALCRLDAGAHQAAGRRDRPPYLGAGRDHPARAHTPRARLPRLRRHPAAGQDLWSRAARSHLQPSTRDRCALL
jgi:transposase